MKRRTRTQRFLLHLLVLRRRLKEKNLLLLLSFLVGVFTALAGMLLKWLIGQIQHLLTNQLPIQQTHVLYLIYPAVGILLTMLFIRYVVRDDIGHGITKILFAIARKQSFIKVHNCWSSVCASAITIGFGGSVGAEAPIVLTGSAIGSNLGRLFRLNSRQMMLLVGCGAAGAVAGIFKAPIAGLVFVLEVLMIDLTMGSLLPLLVTCVTAATIMFAFTGTDTMFSFRLFDGFRVERFPAYIALGIVCGLVSLYFVRTMNNLEDMFRRIRGPFFKFFVGAASLSVLIFLFPSLYGEGYELIDLLLNGHGNEQWSAAMEHSVFYGHDNLLLVYLLFVMVFKVFATTATNGGGGCGGTFAPSLFLGCVTGFVFSRLWNMNYIFGIHAPENNFAMLGMCGLMSGVMHAPLTGIFLIAELTGGYGLFMPLITVSVCSYLTISIFEPHGIYSARLARSGDLLTHNKDNAILTLMSMDSVLDRYSYMLEPQMTLRQVIVQISNSSHNVFPVVNAERRLVAVLYIDDIRHLMFRTELYERFTVAQLMVEPKARLTINDSMECVVKEFEKTRAWALPVVEENGHFVGFIRKSKVFVMYRRMMKDSSAE